MKREELVKAVMQLIDQNNMEMSLSEYAEAMEEIADDCSSRAEAARNDIESESN